VYSIDGKGYRSFAVMVGFSAKDRGGKEAKPHNSLVNFEIYVDGTLRTQSGLMKHSDAPRLLVVDGLENARELKIRNRYDLPEARNLGAGPGVQWIQPRFFREGAR
jgi:hypothetical protein